MALVLGACGEGPQPPEVLASALYETEFLQRPGRVAFREETCWIGARAWLHVGAIGVGTLRVEVAMDGLDDTVLLDATLTGGIRSETLELPGTDPRPLIITLKSTGDVTLLAFAVQELRAPAQPPPTRLPGSMRGRNVVVFVADSLHAEHLSGYGYERDTSPYIDRIAEAGVRFRYAYSQTSWTLSSVSSLFTSVEQERHGVLELDQRLGDEFSTLAELFSSAGYRTVGLIQNGIIWPATGLDRGFAEYTIFPWHTEGTRQLMARAVEVMLEVSDDPFFLYVHLTPPHQPYQPPASFRELYLDPEYDGEVDGSIISCAIVAKASPPAGDPDVRRLAALYDGHIRYVDDQIGNALRAMLGAGRLNELLVVVTSDHGEAFLQHGAQGHNSHVYEEMVRIPLVFYAPESPIPVGQVVDAPVTLLDVMPTLIDLCALEPPRHRLRGASLVGLLESHGASVRSRPESFVPRSIFMTSRYKDDPAKLHAAIRIGRHKLVTRGGRAFLYDLVADPGETEDLAAQRPVHARVLEHRLDAWYADATSRDSAAETVALDPARRQAIRALGYGGK